MSVYFEKRLTNNFGDVCTDITWYKSSRLAVSCQPQNETDYIHIFDGQVKFAFTTYFTTYY